MNKDALGDDIEITAVDEIGEVMAIRHKQYDVRGVQFHPESIMTQYGHKLLQNWLNDDDANKAMADTIANNKLDLIAD